MATPHASPTRVGVALRRSRALSFVPELVRLEARFGDDVFGAWRALAEPDHLALLAYGAGVDPRRILRAHASVIRALAAQAWILVIPIVEASLSMIEEWDDDAIDSGQVGLTAETVSGQVLRIGQWSRDERTKVLCLATHAQLNALAVATTLVGHNTELGVAEALAREVARGEIPFQLGLAAASLQPLLEEATCCDEALGPRTTELIRRELDVTHLEAAVAGRPTHPTGPYAFG